MTGHSFKNALQRSHNRHVGRYAQAACLIDTVGDALLERLSFIMIKPQRILDLGSALGKTSRTLSLLYPEADIIALDFCQAMNKQAQANCHDQPTIKILTADAYQLPIANHSVDLIVANLLLPALLDYPRLWQECMRVLVPGGLLMFSNLGPDSLKELDLSFAAIDPTPRVNAFIDLHDTGDSLVKATFMDPVLDNDYFHLSYPSLTALLQELKSVGSIKFIEHADPSYVGKTFWRAVEDYYRHHFPAPKQRLMVTIEAYFGHAFNPYQKPHRLDNDGNVSIPIAAIKRPPSP